MVHFQRWVPAANSPDFFITVWQIGHSLAEERISPDARSARSVNNPAGLPDRTTITPTFTCYFNTKLNLKHHVTPITPV